MDEDSVRDEIDLVRQAKSGDKEAFGQLMENHALRAYRIAFATLQNQNEAEDAVQEAFITAYKSIKKLEKEESFGSWLGRIVTTRAYDVLRQKHRGQKAVDSKTSALKQEIAQSSTTPVEDKEALSLDLRQAIDELPELHRLAIMLRYTEDATADQIARIVNRPAGTVRRILSESYNLLRLYLKGDDD